MEEKQEARKVRRFGFKAESLAAVRDDFLAYPSIESATFDIGHEAARFVELAEGGKSR